jgi:hypothetical protein
MRSLYNLIAVLAVAFTAFYLGRSCTLREVANRPVVTDTTMSSLLVKKLDSTMHVLDSIKEENREMDITIVNQQDQLRLTKEFMSSTAKRADDLAVLYHEAKAKKDVPAMLHNCDSIVQEYDTYRFACDSFVQEADSIMSNMYIINQRQDQMIKDLNGLVDELSMKYMESVSASMIATTGEMVEKKRKKKWRSIAIIAAAIVGMNLLTR